MRIVDEDGITPHVTKLWIIHFTEKTQWLAVKFKILKAIIVSAQAVEYRFVCIISSFLIVILFLNSSA